MWSKIEGSKTYLFSAAIALLGAYEAIDAALTALGVIDLPAIPTWLWALLGGGTAASLRHAVAKTAPPPANP